MERRFLWTFSPITYGLERRAASSVYHCVDLLEHFPGVDGDAFRAGERALAAAGVPVIASSPGVARHARDVGFSDVDLWENVAEVDLFAERAQTSQREPGLVVFAGNITDYKVDFDLLLAVARHASGLRLVLAGPVADGGGSRPARFDELLESGAEWVGPLSPEPLAELFSRACVGLIPYRLNAYTEGVFPMKLYEYLAAGLAVVSTPLPALLGRPVADLHITSDADDFAKTTAALATPTNKQELARRLTTAADHSWATRGMQARQLIDAMLGHSVASQTSSADR